MNEAAMNIMQDAGLPMGINADDTLSIMPKENKQNGLQPRGEFERCRFIESQKKKFQLSLNKRMNITSNNLSDTIMIHYTDLMAK